MRKNVIVHTSTKEDWEKVIQKCFENGISGGFDLCFWNRYKGDSCINILAGSSRSLEYCDLEYYKKSYPSTPIISAQEFLEERKFKVGDRVVGNHETKYSITRKGWIGEVVKIDGGRIYVGNGIDPTPYLVEEKYFDLVEEKLEGKKFEYVVMDEVSIGLRSYHCDFVGGVESSIIKPNFMSVIKNIFKSKERKALENFSIVNGDSGLTETGRGEFVDYLFEVMTEEKKAFIAKIIEAYDEQKK